MAYDEIADAVVQRRAAILAPSQCELLLREWRRLEEMSKHAYEEGK